jgi:hypothetical protein
LFFLDTLGEAVIAATSGSVVLGLSLAFRRGRRARASTKERPSIGSELAVGIHETLRIREICGLVESLGPAMARLEKVTVSAEAVELSLRTVDLAS